MFTQPPDNDLSNGRPLKVIIVVPAALPFLYWLPFQRSGAPAFIRKKGVHPQETPASARMVFGTLRGAETEDVPATEGYPGSFGCSFSKPVACW
jgi:hypothetical protein